MDILGKLGLKFEDLEGFEKETLMSWYRAIEKKTVSFSNVKDYVKRLRLAVDSQLALDNLTKTQDLFLKARLKNLMLLEAFMTGPEEAKKALETYIDQRKV